MSPSFIYHTLISDVIYEKGVVYKWRHCLKVERDRIFCDDSTETLLQKRMLKMFWRHLWTILKFKKNLRFELSEIIELDLRKSC